MPYKRTYKKRRTTRPKRTYKKRYSRSSRVNAVARSPGQLPLPNRILTRHRYVQECPLNANSSTAAGYTFALNGLYDPDISGSGHQPMGFDQFTALYQNYKVLGAKVTAKFTIDAQSTSTGQFVGIQFHENQAYSPTSYDQIMERGRCTSRYLSGTEALPFAQCSMKWSGKKWYGSNNFKGGDTAGTISSNPAQMAYVSAFSVQDYPTEDPIAVPC